MPWFVACCARCPGFRHPVAVVAWHLSVCLGCGRRHASLVCLVAPRGALRLVRSGRSRCPGRLCRRRGAFPHPGGLHPRLYWVAARGTRRPAENRAHCACRWSPPRQGRLARFTSYPFGAPRWCCPWRVPPASVLGCVRCGGVPVWTRSLTCPVSRTIRLSTGDLVCAPGLFRVDVDTAPFESEDATPGSSACVRVRAFLGESGGLACWARSGGPPLFLWPFVVLSLSAPPLRARVACGCSCVFCFFLFFLFFLRPPCLLLFVFSGPGCLGSWRLAPPPPLFFFFFSLFLSPPPLRVFFSCQFFFLFFFVPWCAGCAVLCAGVSSAVGCVGVCCCGPCALAGAAVRLRSVVWCSLPLPPPFVLLLVVLRVPSGAVWCCSPPPPRVLCRVFFFSACRVFSGCAPSPPPGWLWCPLLCFVVRPVLWCCGLWCVLCCARCCVACLCRGGFLRRVVRRGVVLHPVFVVLCCRALLRSLLVVFFALSLAFRWCSGLLLFLCSVCAVLCWCACVVALCAVLSCPCCAGWCVVACCVCVFAVGPGCPLLSSGWSWWLLLPFFGGVLCCVPGCCAAPCCCAFCRLALCCCALCCFVLLCLVLLRAVSCPGVLSVVLGSCAFWRSVLSCLPALCVKCCGVLLRGAVRRCALRRVRPGVSCCAFPVLSALCGAAVRPCSSLVPCSPVLCPVVLSCRVVLWCPVLLPCLICFLCSFGFS